MSKALLCNGCLDFETVDSFNESLTFIGSDDETEYHLCTECTKKFHKWIKTIEEKS